MVAPAWRRCLGAVLDGFDWRGCDDVGGAGRFTYTGIISDSFHLN